MPILIHTGGSTYICQGNADKELQKAIQKARKSGFDLLATKHDGLPVLIPPKQIRSIEEITEEEAQRLLGDMQG